MPLEEVSEIDNEAELFYAKLDANDYGEQCHDIENDDANEYVMENDDLGKVLVIAEDI